MGHDNASLQYSDSRNEIRRRIEQENNRMSMETENVSCLLLLLCTCFARARKRVWIIQSDVVRPPLIDTYIVDTRMHGITNTVKTFLA